MAEHIPTMPPQLRQKLNWDLRDKQLDALDDNARFIVRRIVARAYTEGYDDGLRSGYDDAHTDQAIQKDRAETESETPDA